MSRDHYQTGFGNHFATEAVEGALPQGQNSPQKCPLNLYAEQLSGTAFTVPRSNNQRSWLYRIRPTISDQTAYQPLHHGFFSNDFEKFLLTPTQLRWKASPFPESRTDWVDGIVTVAGVGDPLMKSGLAIYTYCCNASMENRAFYSSDGDFIIVPQHNTLLIVTEMGRLEVEPLEICVSPRGIKFSVEVNGNARGYIAEVFNGHFKIPDLGPIGANGLANPRDFLAPTAHFEDRDCEFRITAKFGGKLFEHSLNRSIFDVVAWHGNYYPYKYDLRHFSTINTVSFDHPDPSIFTVLTCPSLEPGVAVLDFVIFPPRWMVSEHTFRPPYYHRNCMSEYMGNIVGGYDAKGAAFGPGCGSLHSCMSAHGPDRESFEKGSNVDLTPHRYPDGNMQFMFESSYVLKIAPWALEEERLDTQYLNCWRGLNKHFSSS
jgi:homogentisate 1,2-dioxygenase